MALAPLIDRDDELRRLRGHWDAVGAGESRLVLVRGRRQVGKTFLLAHFAERIGAPGRILSFTALPRVSARQQLDVLVEDLRRLDHPWPPERLQDWTAAWRWVATAASGQDPWVVVLDEAPYLVESDPAFPGHLQRFWDEVRRQAKPPRLLLILTGSSVATMTTLTSASGALFGRPDDELVVHPFDLPTAASVLSGSDPAAIIEAYAACGGYPFHLRSWDRAATAEENLRRLAFTPGGLLLRNGEQVMGDVPHEGAHRQTLHAIGMGAHRRSAIQSAVGQRVDRPLELLERATLVGRRRPLGAPDRTPEVWRVNDPFLQGWYELCWADREQIEAGLGEGVAHARQGRWQRHLGVVFEEQARAHAVRLAKRGHLPADARYGEWWTTSGAQVQIDVLGLVGRRTELVGEARWSERPLDRRALEELRAKERAAPDPVAQPVFATWSRGGVDEEVERAGVRAFVPADMLERPDPP